MKTYIILMPVLNYDRIDCEKIKGQEFTKEEFQAFCDQNPDLDIFQLHEFTTFCNDKGFKSKNYWITYIIVKYVIFV